MLHRGRLRLLCNLGGSEVTLELGTRIERILLASEPVEALDDAITMGPERFAVVMVA